jgi:hypothetical protein
MSVLTRAWHLGVSASGMVGSLEPWGCLQHPTIVRGMKQVQSYPHVNLKLEAKVTRDYPVYIPVCRAIEHDYSSQAVRQLLIYRLLAGQGRNQFSSFSMDMDIENENESTCRWTIINCISDRLTQLCHSHNFPAVLPTFQHGLENLQIH